MVVIKDLKRRRLKPQEKLLLELLENLEEITNIIFPNSIFYKYNGKIVFEKDIKKDIIIIDYYTFSDMTLLNEETMFTDNFNILVYERFNSKYSEIKFSTSLHRPSWYIFENHD